MAEEIFELPLDGARAELAAAKKIYPRVGRVFLEEGMLSRGLPRGWPKSRGLRMNFTLRLILRASPRYTT